MTIFTNSLKRICSSKIQLFFILLLPFMFMSFAFIQPAGLEIRTAIIDRDNTRVTQVLTSLLDERFVRVEVAEHEIDKQLSRLKVDYVLVLDAGFTSKLIQGEGPQARGYYVSESNLSQPVRAWLDEFLASASQIAIASGNDETRFYAGLDSYLNGGLTFKQVKLERESTERSRAVLGYLTLSMLYSSVVCSFMILINKNNRTFYRTLTSGVTVRSYMFQTVCSFLLVAIAQVTFLFLFLRFGIDLYLGESALQMYLLFVAFSFVSVALGIAVSAFAKSILQAGVIGICVVPPIAMLGGVYWPMDTSPELLRTIGDFLPISWVMKSAEQLLEGQSLWSMGGNLAVIGLFAVILFLLGSVRKADIAK